MVGAEVTRPRGERERSRDGVPGRLLQPCCTEDYVAASFRSTESEKTVKRPMGRPGKSARSNSMATRKKTRRMSR